MSEENTTMNICSMDRHIPEIDRYTCM